MFPALSALAIGAVVLIIFYGEEDLRGGWVWKSYLKRTRITAEQLDFHTYIPKPVPDEENFAATPVIKRWFETQSRNEPFKSDHFSKAPPLLVQSLKSVEKKKNLQRLDLNAWANGLKPTASTDSPSTRIGEVHPPSRQEAAAVILDCLQDDEATIQSLSAASDRSKCVYPVSWTLDDPWGILLPHDSNIQNLAVRLELKACAELEQGNSARAFDDVMLTLYLADSLTNDPLVVSYLVRAECVHAAVQPIWEGIAERRWSDSQLGAMEARLLNFNFIGELEKPFATDRAAAVLTIDLTETKGSSYLARTVSTEPTIFGGILGGALDCAVPSGWFRFEKANYCRSFDTLFFKAFDPVARTVSPLQAEANLETFKRDAKAAGETPTSVICHHWTVARLFLPTLPKVLFRGAIAQTAASEAAFACALERNHLANGQYPGTLQSLVPDWMPSTPHDAVGGHDYHYRRVDADHFVLYSIGWDESDDGGTIGESLFGREGDWVWKNSDR
jgi:hypothetical protein